jgi:uridine kinase
MRIQALSMIADAICALKRVHPIRVAIDGRTASGKTSLADEIAAQCAARGRPTIRTSIDGFHRPKAERYARGRRSAEGYYHDARDLSAVRRLLLDPLGPGGNLLYRTASFDLAADQPLDVEPLMALSNAVLIVDGTFLQRIELKDAWDLVVFVDTPATIAMQRAAQRDAALSGGAEAAQALYAERYGPAWDIYERESDPSRAADIVLDNSDFMQARIMNRVDL